MKDYRKLYEEALSSARKQYCDCSTHRERSILEEIFPEVKEDEDEKIRKRIRLCLEECVHSDIIRDYEMEDALAWLEKQKEQKPDNGLTETNDDAIEQQLNIWFEKGKCSGIDCVLFHPEAYGLCKPAEWSEEDELMRSACIAFIQDEKFKGYERSYECVDWLKSLRTQPSWKPTEEQMNKLNVAIACYEGDWGGDNAKPLRELFEQLKKL